jgi:hypothetical protein
MRMLGCWDVGMWGYRDVGISGCSEMYLGKVLYINSVGGGLLNSNSGGPAIQL